MKVSEMIKFLETLPQDAYLDFKMDTWTMEEGDFSVYGDVIESHEIEHKLGDTTVTVTLTY